MTASVGLIVWSQLSPLPHFPSGFTLGLWQQLERKQSHPLDGPTDAPTNLADLLAKQKFMIYRVTVKPPEEKKSYFLPRRQG